MPNWTYYYTVGASMSSDILWTTDTPLSNSQVQQQYEKYQRERKRQDREYELQMQMHEQEMEKERQLIKDKEKYPLFYWKEGLKDGSS